MRNGLKFWAQMKTYKVYNPITMFTEPYDNFEFAVKMAKSISLQIPAMNISIRGPGGVHEATFLAGKRVASPSILN